jgi:hypothetical protein
MKIMNISDSALFVNTMDKKGLPVGLNGVIHVKTNQVSFEELNPDYTNGKHYVVISDEFDANAITIEPVPQPVEIKDNPPRLIIVPKAEEILIDETFEAAEALNEVVNAEEKEIKEPEVFLAKTQEEWEQFFVRETKNTLKEFAELKGITFQPGANKAGMVEVLTKWLKENNLINNGETT